MKNNRLLIGQMAKLNHTTLATLRHYDKMGILSPVYVNPETGYRYYDVQQCLTFHIIQHHKALNMSLKEIKTILEKNDYDFLETIYKKKLDEVNQSLAEFEFRREELERMMVWSDHFCHRPPEGSIQVGYINSNQVYMEKAQRNYVLEDMGSVIYDLSNMEGRLLKKGFENGYPYNAFVTLRLDDVLRHDYRTDKLGMVIYGKNLGKAGVETLKSQTSAFVYFEDFGKLRAYVDKLLAYCHDHNYTPAGDMVCQIMGLLNINDFMKTTEVLRLQLPVNTGHGKENS